MTHKTLLIIANNGATSAEQVHFMYGILARKLVDYIDITIERVEELHK